MKPYIESTSQLSLANSFMQQAPGGGLHLQLTANAYKSTLTTWHP